MVDAGVEPALWTYLSTSWDGVGDPVNNLYRYSIDIIIFKRDYKYNNTKLHA